MLEITPVHWLGFLALIAVMLALDLGVFHLRGHAVSMKEAAVWSAVWIALSLTFNAGVLVFLGREKALEFLTGYLIEKSLSIDNIFVFVVIFEYFRVAPEHQHRVLFWGILGALVTRGAFVFAGAALLRQFHFVMYVFGGILVVTAFRIAFQRHGPIDVEKRRVVRWARRFIPVSQDPPDGRILFWKEGRLWATPLFLTLLTIEVSDIFFAVDSIPAIFAITNDEFIVFTSNILAVLGLRSLYFLLAGVVERFRYLKYGLAAILLLVGAKMLATDLVEVPNWASLAAIAVIVAVSIAASLTRDG